MAREERRRIIQQIEAGRGSRVICYLTSDRQNAQAMVGKDAIPYFYEHLRAIGDVEKVDILIFTDGGDTLAAFGMSRLAREFARCVGGLVPLKSHSAGTLFLLGTNEIVMTRGATLSPIDPSLVGPLNPVIELAPGQRQIVPLSVESVAGFRSLAEEWGLRGEEAAAVAFRLLAERVNPLALGNVFRSRQQIERLARTLMAPHRGDDKNIGRVVSMLTRDLGSHDYIISRTEARELLGNQICVDDPGLENLVWELFRDFSEEMQLGTPYDPSLELHAAAAAAAAAQSAAAALQTPSAAPGDPLSAAPAIPLAPPSQSMLPAAPAAVRVVQRLAIIESAQFGHACENELELTRGAPTLQMTPMGPVQNQGQPREELVRAGWRRYP